MDILFPEGRQILKDRDIIFFAVVDARDVTCRISAEALEDVFSARRDAYESAFNANRSAIEGAAMEKIMGGVFEEDGTILLRSADFPPEMRFGP